jgi:hypothetical protein
VLIPVVIAVLAVGGVAVAAQQGAFGGGGQTAAPTPTVVSAEQTPDPTSSASASETPSAASPSASADASSSSSPDPTVQRALDSCRAGVKARDAVLAAAKVGVGHWTAHVQAQTDANSGKISVVEMDAIFKRTRLAGADDVKAYQEAQKQLHSSSTSCATPSGTSASASRDFARCTDRSKAQQPMLKAARDAMLDWESHLAAMMRSRMGHVHDAQGVWIRAWKAAPPHIKAYKKAATSFADAPSC